MKIFGSEHKKINKYLVINKVCNELSKKMLKELD